MYKKVILFCLMILCFSSNSVFAEEEPIRVYIDGEIIEFVEQPIIENGTTLVQFRPIFEKLGLSIEWKEDTRTVIGSKDGLSISLNIDDTNAIVNGNNNTLELAPRIINGNTMVPLRFVGESTGNSVDWVGETRSIFIRGFKESIDDTAKTNKPTLPMSMGHIQWVDGESIKSRITSNTLGTAELHLVATNLTDINVVAFEFECEFLDAFDRPVYRLGTESTLFKGLIQGSFIGADMGTIKSTSGTLTSTGFGVYKFNLVLYEGANKIKDGAFLGIKLTKVLFEDGTVWERTI